MCARARSSPYACIPYILLAIFFLANHLTTIVSCIFRFLPLISSPHVCPPWCWKISFKTKEWLRRTLISNSMIFCTASADDFGLAVPGLYGFIPSMIAPTFTFISWTTSAVWPPCNFFLEGFFGGFSGGFSGASLTGVCSHGGFLSLTFRVGFRRISYFPGSAY
jgi:hypothetical protein